jgi:hypothetical protein
VEHAPLHSKSSKHSHLVTSELNGNNNPRGVFFVESFQFGSFWSLLQKTLISWNSLIRTTPCISMYLSHETDWAWQSSICVKGPFNQLVEGTCCRKPLYFDHSQWETPVHVPLIQFSESMLFLRNKAKTISFIYRGYIYICISYIYLYNPIYYIYSGCLYTMLYIKPIVWMLQDLPAFFFGQNTAAQFGFWGTGVTGSPRRISAMV